MVLMMPERAAAAGRMVGLNDEPGTRHRNEFRKTRLDGHQLLSGGNKVRLFFHVHDGTTILDDEGTDFPDVNAARDEAIRTCGEMVREVPAIIQSGGGDVWRLWVTDQPDGR